MLYSMKYNLSALVFILLWNFPDLAKRTLQLAPMSFSECYYHSLSTVLGFGIDILYYIVFSLFCPWNQPFLQIALILFIEE
jgi:hypothetical protein